MFYSKQKAAIAALHPGHQKLIYDRGLSVTAYPQDWSQMIASLQTHEQVVTRKKWALPDRTLPVVVPLIRVVSEDMDPQAPLAVNADLTGTYAPGKKSNQISLPLGPGTPRGVYKVLEHWAYDPWLSIDAPLHDGSHLKLSIADKIRYRTVKKRTYRGKYKSKDKVKAVHVVSASRRMAKKTDIVRPQTPPPPWISVKVKPGPKPTIKVTAKLDAPPGTVGPRPSLTQDVLAVMAEMFRWTPPHPETKRKKGGHA